jgi:hypothetical protein
MLQVIRTFRDEMVDLEALKECTREQLQQVRKRAASARERESERDREQVSGSECVRKCGEGGGMQSRWLTTLYMLLMHVFMYACYSWEYQG